MKPIIIGAGRGARLRALTENQPKCYTPIGGRRILDWMLEAITVEELDSPTFIGGYLIDVIQEDYPQFSYRHNAGWAENNVLLSLFHAEEDMADGFVCTYSDILFSDSVVRRALEHPADIVICVDIHWRERYVHRTEHPEDDAEKVTLNGDRVTRVHREIPSEDSHGEYIGVAKFTAEGAAQLKEHFYRIHGEFSGKNWPNEKPFEKSYLIHLLEEMIQNDVPVHCVTTEGDYMEIDTEQDYALANEYWPAKFSTEIPKE
ncbi:MAG: sugar phosphate nucleotidyltransferase [Planctomycetota bacterium]|nr:sugar phosphate nucleotidyltransferase [Planctomycetota bacterium]MDA1140260.1 sugar phosphate nucleotidyltransferase [Planctomycetota bacterium]